MTMLLVMRKTLNMESPPLSRVESWLKKSVETELMDKFKNRIRARNSVTAIRKIRKVVCFFFAIKA